MAKISRIVVPMLSLWLLSWIGMSWPAIQDDALIHLRYADDLVRYHFITYDGVHPDYGSSSLFYVSLLAGLRAVSQSANLARAVSSFVHMVLFLGLAFGLSRRLARTAGAASLAGTVLLVLTAMPSAVRWLDDGMETGLVACVACLLAWWIHGEMNAAEWLASRYLRLTALAFLAVLLRTELLLLCAGGFFVLMLNDLADREGRPARGMMSAARQRSHVLVGGAAAAGLIFTTMHSLLPDTAIAKSHGIASWYHPIHDAAITLGGAFSFGVGLLLLWLLTLVLVAVRVGGLTIHLAVANSFAPTVLILSALRGQEIQGVRYFAWTFFFSTVWNVLELARPAEEFDRSSRHGKVALFVLLLLIVIDLPFEAVAMHRVLVRRSETVRMFEAERLDVLRHDRGIASDIGYIGYFTQATICDLAGLVNGRGSARMSSLERARACVKISPDFMFVNLGQLIPLTKLLDLSQWEICGSYDFANVTTADTHYLLVRPERASLACSATSRSPVPIVSILPVSDRLSH